VSLPEHVSKRMKTLHEDGTGISSPIGSTKKGPVTYNKEPKSTDSSPFLHLVNIGINTDSPVPMYDTDLGLEGTMCEGYIQHDPMALFPEPSSTIPNATLTQQRVLEGVLAPALLGVESESDLPPHQRVPDGSVPWSDILRFSPTGTAEQSELSDPRVRNEPETVPIKESSKRTQESSKSQRSRRGSSVRLRGSPLRSEVMPESIDPKDVMPPPQLTLPSQDVEYPSTTSGVSQAVPQGKNRKPSQQQNHDASPVPNSEEDLAGIGLPVEQYKPRPSRSRSLKVSTDEPIDFSVRPEKAPKGTKRRKTTPAATTGTTTPEFIATPEKVRQICDMGFTPTSTGRALKQNNGDVTVTVEWLITNGLGEDELASSNTATRSSGLKKVKPVRPTVAENSLGVEESTVSEVVDSGKLPVGTKTPNKPNSMKDKDVPVHNTNATITTQQKSPKVQVVIPVKSPKPKTSFNPDSSIVSNKKTKRQKTTSDLPEAEAPLEVIPPPELVTEKKRGRGRPKKIANTVTSTEPMQSITEETQPELRKEADTILQTIEPNAMAPTTSILSGTHASEDFKDRTPASVVTPKDTAPAAVLSRTPEQTIKPASRSPLSKGKTPYRVGLSKRARIAPLLRTLKK
jgi:hypothetical protein